MKLLAIGLLLITTHVVGDDNPPKLNRFDYSQVLMGTQFRISLYASDRATANEASSAAYARVEQLNTVLSDYDPHSEVRQMCSQTGPVVVSQPLFDVLSASQRMAAESDGAFDATVGPFVGLWRKARLSRKLPHSDLIAKARDRVGYRLIALNASDRSVELRRADLRIDLGGIAKGYAADEALKALKKFGIRSALIDAGGDIVCSDAPPHKQAWVIAVGKKQLQNTNHPDDVKAKDNKRRLIQITNAAVATSGDQFQFVEFEGKRYSHIVDPKTGMGLTQRRNVTVIAKDGMTADGLASAISVMGQPGFRLLKKYSAAALIIEIDPSATHESQSFADYRFEIPAIPNAARPNAAKPDATKPVRAERIVPQPVP